MVIEKEKRKLEVLPSGKFHISFSELTTWINCSYRYVLSYVQKLSIWRDNHYADFGTAIHKGLETFLETRSAVSVIVALNLIRFFWDIGEKYEDAVPLKTALEQGKIIFQQLPDFFEKNFPGWKPVAAEEFLFEEIDEEGHPHVFKGFIDCVISTPNGRKKYWILDAKTSMNGWFRDKRRDEKLHRQLVLYKHFWSQKHNIPLNEIGTAFMIFKRNGKPGADRIELIKISVGPKTIEKHLRVLHKALTGIKKKTAYKNRSECKFCEFANTDKCKGYVDTL
jgi:RecB family exonuclease